MSDPSRLIVVLCTVPDEETAERLGRGLVEEGLAACVNAIPGVRSYYRWRGSIQSDAEIQLLIKTGEDRFDALVAWLRDNHPYQVPEIVALRAQRVSESYLSWALEQTASRGR
jgi:periplasmic divalent cation tolerance protein